MISIARLVYSFALAWPAVAQGQFGRVLLRGTHLSGEVTDQNGNPLADVWIDHAALQGQGYPGKSNINGNFNIQTQARAIVFRKDGFNGRYYRVQSDDTTLQVKLEPAQPFRACQASSKCVSLKGFPSLFCLQRVRGVTVTKQENDVDYGYRWFIIQTPAGKRGVRHGAGRTWSLGRPFDRDVWSAAEYRETDFRDLDGFLIIDARGQDASGGNWRVLGHAFETASYRNMSPNETGLLDKVLDSACVWPRPN